jgi:putative transposase
MARLPRLALAGYPHHVLQRGHNRQAIFLGEADYAKWLGLLEENAKKFDVAVHAYVLMPNHFQLLATPQSELALPQMMQAIGRSYVRYFNDRHHRTGTLWDGRYKSTVLQADLYLLPCMAYLDLHPVQEGLAANAVDYAWSSHRHYIGQRVDKLIAPHALVWSLGNTPFAREAAYAELVRHGINPVHQQTISDATLSGWALGEADFVADLQRQTTRRLTKRLAGRPQNPKQQF